jgi:hypothetical protein
LSHNPIKTKNKKQKQMKNNTNTKIKLSQIYGLPFLKKSMNEEIIDMTIENIIKKFKEIELEKNKSFSSKKAIKISKRIIKISDNIIESNKSQINLLDKNEYDLNMINSEKLNSINNINSNKSKLILMNDQQYIKLISPFNSKLANISNNIYTFTNKSYKKINKNLNNLYLICKSAFLNMSSIISKPIISNNSNLIKITLFYY